ncbi:MAG: substrate-binding domain-containing protein [Luteolibacter sp.]
MAELHVLSASQQVANHLRGEIARGRWTEVMPGCNHLLRELGVGRNTIDAALLILEEEGLLAPQGIGRRRRIIGTRNPDLKALTIQLLLYEKGEATRPFLLDLVHALRELGITTEFTGKTLDDLKMDRKKVIRFVEKTEADIWLVQGASREILEWFATQPVPAFAIMGRLASVDIAGVGTLKSPAVDQAVKRLVELGHRRVVMMTRPERRRPQPGLFERQFLESLEASGLRVGPYNLPDWDNDPQSFRRCLESLFAHTPPTALFFSEAQLHISALHFFSGRGLRVPRDVSMICHDSDSAFDWQMPVVSHLRWDSKMLARHVLRWVRQVARGKANRRQKLIKAEFVEGETIAPAPK